MKAEGDVCKPNLRRKMLVGLVCCAAGLIPVSQSSLCLAQAPAPNLGIVDTWQGTLHIPAGGGGPGRDLRIVNKVTKGDDGKLKVMDYSIDQGGAPIAATSASFEGGVFKYAIVPIDGSYEGKISADGKSIAGNWTQGGNPLPLLMERATPETEWTIPPPPPPRVPMAADANPSFDVATIKPSTPNRPGKGFGFRGTEFVTQNTNLNDLIAFAYGLHSKQIVDAPAWFDSDLYDIVGKPDTPGQPNLKQMGIMVQKLLTDRFKLQFHRDKRSFRCMPFLLRPVDRS